MPTMLLDPPDITDATRREILTSAGAALLLTACGRTAPEPPAATATRTVTDDANRTVEIPALPARIVGADDGVAAAALAQGVPLIAIGTRGCEVAPPITRYFDTTASLTLSFAWK